jgi:hypothetical protein
MQIARSFDRETLIKIAKGFLISATGAGALYLLSMLGQIEFTNPQVAYLVSWGVPFLVNVIKEWLKGV